MRESSGYQLILDEGAVLAMRKLLLRQGRHKFGPPTAEVEAAIQAIEDQDWLERMSERLLDVTTWQDLLAAR
jgi:hypothetical protein